MEDEDVEGRVPDAWTLGSEVRSSQNEESLKRSSKVLSETCVSPLLGYNNEICVEENKEDRCSSSETSEDSPGKLGLDGACSKIVFKGFKKRILAQTQENQIGNRGNSHENCNSRGGAREKRASEGKRGKITEYAQYLGLQPAAPTNNRSKCSRCVNQAATANSCAPSMLKPHSPCSCTPSSSPGLSESPPPPPLPPPASSAPSAAPSSANNFRITRKVYLCAACGTYFENWNLFLHMREIHKRHICLFCLGMFGQAERLSYHLAKKHSVPESAFTSVDDFNTVFKGSCYLICCTCEKVFTETDNFYNHYCSPVHKVRLCGEVCSLCRQTGTHLASCSLAEGREVPQSPGGLPGIPGKDSPNQRTKRTLKNNRLKRSEEAKLTSYQQKLSEMYARKMSGSKSRESQREATSSSGDEAALSTVGVSLETATTTTSSSFLGFNESHASSKSPRDTVSETIMEVSKCTDEYGASAKSYVEPEDKSSCVKIESSPCPTSPSRSPSPLRRQSDASLYDSVAETIMEVSRCSNDSSPEEADEEVEPEARRESRDTGSEGDALVMDESGEMENDGESANGKEDYDDRLKPPTGSERRRRTTEGTQEEEEETIEISDSEDECSSDPSPTGSPPRLNSTGDTTEAYSSPDKESQTTSVSFTTVNATDRSLVIKICTNRNSQFSVTPANGPSSDHNENHDTSRESEENNNGEDSASEKHSNHSGRASANSYRAEEEEEEDEQSDSSTGKLAVVDEEQRPEEPPQPVDHGDTAQEETDTPNAHLDQQNPENTSVPEHNLKSPEENNETSLPSEPPQPEIAPPAEPRQEDSDGIVLAPEDVPSIDVNVEGLLETMEIEELLKRCISAASGYCVYCNHARHIAVNGKQLSLHVLAEHRFQPQHPAIIIQREQFTSKVKKSIPEVDSRFFNLDSFDSERGTYEVQTPRTFECFHCRFHSLVHKDIYLHNRKMHQKTILICIMCKSTFYSYSELLCHLCPGVYSPNVNVTYRCCLCTVSNLPSAFRLMVHLRKRHHSCDVCLESTGNQQRLSNHVWKHKLHHLCYRCGIAYRNKPDITKHLFWKHGTESVLCKKCLQKKWPHVYHFCIPPTAFVCEECTSTFSRAVALKVHKRLHSGDRPYGCSECPERFISKKLLAKHEASHREPEKLPEAPHEEKRVESEDCVLKESTERTSTPSDLHREQNSADNNTVESKEPKEVVKKVVDVYDLPPLNLSSESDSDSDDQTPPEKPAEQSKEDKNLSEQVGSDPPREETEEKQKGEEGVSNLDPSDAAMDPEVNEEVKKEEAQIMDGIWDNFKSYAASLEKSSLVEATVEEEKKEEERLRFLCEVIQADHDYCMVSGEKAALEELKEDAKGVDSLGTMEGEHDYGYKQASKSSNPASPAFNGDSDTNNAKKKKDKSPKKKKQSGSTSSSDSSSDSDSSSCSCGTNCSCSSSSSGSSSSSSSSSDSESSGSESSPRKSSARKERRREKDKEANAGTEASGAKLEAKVESTEEKVASIEDHRVNNEEEVPQQNEDNNQSVEICEPSKSPQLILRESDLDTDETETDEDFYDEHPQQLANKLLAEKRNQLMLLAAVAPASNESSNAGGATAVGNSMNNGGLETDSTIANSLETRMEPETRSTASPRGQTRKRVKTKKRKKADRGKTQRVATPTVESIKLNIPKSFYQKKQASNASNSSMITVLPSRSSTPGLQNNLQDTTAMQDPSKKSSRMSSVGGSGSETENKRSSKRKRVPKRFYGDSSDEEADRQHQQQQHHLQQHLPQQLPTPAAYSQPSLKWRKVENQNFVPSVSIKMQQPSNQSGYPTKNVTLRLSGFDQPMERIVPMNPTANASATESEEPADSSSAESTENEDNAPTQQATPAPPEPPHHVQPPPVVVPTGNPTLMTPTNSAGGPERNVNLYCYCQCPYDEVSEMIACDGDDCRIEWFHFECVGIMVPPKGKWYCPDCRKKDSSLPGNEEYFED